MKQLLSFLSIGVLVLLLFVNKRQETAYQLINNTPYTLLNVRMFGTDLSEELAPKSQLEGCVVFSNREEAVLVFVVDGLQYGIYIAPLKKEMIYRIAIDTIVPSERKVIISP